MKLKTVFPVINNIDDVLPHIAERTEFIIADKGSYTAIDYNVMMGDTFVSDNELTQQVRREMRGIIFCNRTGEILRRPLHKFFNIGQTEEVFHENLDFSREHLFLEKLDGSMIAPFIVDGEVLWGTKLGYTQISKLVDPIINESPKWNNFADVMINHCGYTPIFEFTSPHHPIVLQYDKDELRLLAMRHMNTGEYSSYSDMTTIASHFDIPVVSMYDVTSQNLDKISALKDEEGIIIRWNDGGMVKLKSDWYCRLHNALDSIRFENNLVNIIIHDELDDLIGNLDMEAHFVREYNAEFWYNVQNKVSEIYQRIHSVPDYTAKEFALWVKEIAPKEEHTLYFKLRNIHKSDSIGFIKDFINKQCSSRTKLEGVRFLIGCEKYYKNRMLND